MATKAPAKPVQTKEEKAAEAKLSPEAVLGGILAAHPEDHYNYEEEVVYRVSTGSLNMDLEMAGGIGPGLFSTQGPFETGKTSFTLEVMRNFLKTVPNSRGFYIKSEGRLSKEMQERSGITFVFGKWITVEGKKVFDTSDWVDGTCFVLESNIYETCLNAMRALVTKNPLKKRYMFFVDSMDGMTLKDDMPKDLEGGVKVAGAPLLTKRFLQKMANAMAKRGHICAISGQVSANIQLDPYSPAPQRSGPGGGGSAKDHWSNFILVFPKRIQDDYILEKPDQKQDRFKNKILGHQCKIRIVKSPNEKSNITVTYPIRYGRTGGKSVWIEAEVVDMLMTFQLLVKNGTWLKIAEVLVKELEENSLKDVPAQLQGADQWRTVLESRPDVTTYLFERFKKMVSST